MRLHELERANEEALAQRPFTSPSYQFEPISPHDHRLHELKGRYPYFGYIEIEVENVRPFVMFSNNDDLVAQIYFWFGPDAYETTSVKIWRRLVRQHRTIIDIGSYTGLYSLVAAIANPDATVVAIEPMREVFQRLIDNLAVNRMAQDVRALRFAIGDRDGGATLYDFHGPMRLSTGSSLIEKSRKPVRDMEQVQVRRLDSLVAEGSIPAPEVMKIDVEQGEVAAVRGMLKVVTDSRPKLIIEVTGPENLGELIDLLHPLGYDFAVIHDLTSTVAVNDPDSLTDGVANVFFAAARPEQLESFCSPLAKTYIA